MKTGLFLYKCGRVPCSDVFTIFSVCVQFPPALSPISPRLLDGSHASSEDPLDAFMSEVRKEAAMDAVERRKLHVHVADLRKEAQRVRRLVELTRPAQLPSLQPR